MVKTRTDLGLGDGNSRLATWVHHKCRDYCGAHNRHQRIGTAECLVPPKKLSHGCRKNNNANDQQTGFLSSSRHHSLTPSQINHSNVLKIQINIFICLLCMPVYAIIAFHGGCHEISNCTISFRFDQTARM